MHRTNQDPAAKDGGPVSQELRDEVMAELAQLNGRLLPRLRQWESRFEATFVYHGVSYIAAMEADARRMPEVRGPAPALARRVAAAGAHPAGPLQLAVAAAATQYRQEDGSKRSSPKQPRS